MRSLPPLFALIFLLLFLASGGLYLAEQGRAFFGYLLRSRSFESVLADDDTSPGTVELLEEAESIRRFAREELGLAAGENYTAYIETGKEYLVDVVTACKDDSFTPRIWGFPIVGEVPYKGFYRREDALKLARRLEADNYDVIVRPVDAFSSLGFFSDPLYDFMRDYSDFELADLIIHELTHATIFVKSEIQFNEELATFVGYEGALRYAASRDLNGGELRRLLKERAAERAVFLELMRGLYSELEEAYRALDPRQDRLAAKEEILDRFRRGVTADYENLFATDRFRFLTEAELNNAYILSWNIYARDLSLFEELYARYDKDLGAFISSVKPVESYGGDPKDFLRELLSRNSSD